MVENVFVLTVNLSYRVQVLKHLIDRSGGTALENHVS